MGPQPTRVLNAAIRGAERRAQSWRIAPDDFFNDVEALRSAFAELIDSPPDNVAIVPSASYGIATAARNIVLAPGESIMVLADQFPSNYYSWQRLADSSGGELAVISRRKGESWTTAILDHLHINGKTTRVAAIPNHHWATGETIDVVEVCRQLHELQSTIVLDLTQTVGACPVDIGALDPDYVAVAGYKWLFCPYGLSFMYVAKRNLDGEPIEENWASRRGSDDFSQLAAYTDHYQDGARRFDMGERASFSNVAAGLEAMRVLNEWRVSEISETIGAINLEITSILRDFGFTTLDPASRAPHIQSAGLSGGDSRKIARVLGENNVFVSQRGNDLRIAPHVFNDTEDLQRLRKALAIAVR